MHPHDWAAEADSLIIMALEEPDSHMPDDHWLRLRTLMVERSTSTNIDMRPFEREYATMFLLAMTFARREAIDPAALSSLKLIGTQSPIEQTKVEKRDAQV